MSARGGPAPKPTALRILHGEPNKARINTNEPTPSMTEVKCPANLSAGAKRIWRRYAPDLERKGVLTPWDVEAFGVYCDAAARWHEACRHLDDEGMVIESKRNGMVKNPWFQLWRDNADVMSRYGARFGLTPSDRAQLKVGDNKADTLEQMLS